MTENPNDFARGEKASDEAKSDLRGLAKRNAEEIVDTMGRRMPAPQRPAKREPKVNVTFDVPVGPYSSGESAGFTKAEADRLVSRKQAHYTTTGHAPLNAAILGSTAKSDPAVREKLADHPVADPATTRNAGARPAEVAADDLDELSYPQLRSRAAAKSRDTGVVPAAFDADTLKAFLRS